MKYRRSVDKVPDSLLVVTFLMVLPSGECQVHECSGCDKLKLNSNRK